MLLDWMKKEKRIGKRGKPSIQQTRSWDRPSLGSRRGGEKKGKRRV